MNSRSIKDLLYEHVARVGKAVSSPKRLELIELLAQGEKSVDALAAELSVDIKLASAHLRVLREARLIASRRDGKYVYYRLAGVNAVVALTMNAVILLGAMAWINATLTLPGIAGFILTIGMAVGPT